MSHKIFIPFSGKKPDYLLRTLSTLKAEDVVIVVPQGVMPTIVGDTVYQVFKTDLPDRTNPMGLVLDALKAEAFAGLDVAVILHDDIKTTPEEVAKLVAAVSPGKTAAYGKVQATSSMATKHHDNFRQDEKTVAGHFWAVAVSDLTSLPWPEKSLANKGYEANFLLTMLADAGMTAVCSEAHAYHMNHGSKLPSFEVRLQKRAYFEWMRKRVAATPSPAPTAPGEANTAKAAPTKPAAPAKPATPGDAKAMSVEEMEASLKGG